jgi:ATP-dependent DNA helicase PIF1
MSLNKKQLRAFNLFKEGKSLCITGPAGVGKSFIIKYFYDYAISIKKNISLTAMTGCAAYLINGTTLHSWAGIGLGNENEEILLRKIKRNNTFKMKWLSTDILIIDEISMMTTELFNKLNYIGKSLRYSDVDFGGIQVILVGDFYQLPPIQNNIDDNIFVFESDNFKSLIQETIEFDDIIRQTDKVFQDILNNVRVNKLTDEQETIINQRLYRNLKIKKPNSEIQPTKVYTLKKDVNLINNNKLNELGNEINTFTPKTEFSDINTYTKSNIKTICERLDKQGCYIPELKLCIGAQVMLCVNMMSEGLVNGSRGIILSFNKNGYPVVEFINNITKSISPHSFYHEDPVKGTLYRKQIPLKLAWCITIHKSQGMTLDYAELDIGNSVFEYGQLYVALSRVKSLDGLYLLDFDRKRIKAHPKVIKFYDEIDTYVHEEPKNSIKKYFQ